MSCPFSALGILPVSWLFSLRPNSYFRLDTVPSSGEPGPVFQVLLSQDTGCLVSHPTWEDSGQKDRGTLVFLSDGVGFKDKLKKKNADKISATEKTPI